MKISVAPREMALALALLVSACATTRPATFDAAKLAEIDATVERAIADKRLPGGVIWIERDGETYHRAWGKRAIQPAGEVMTEETIFDAASITKVTATTPSIWLLIERGKLGLEDRVSSHVPEFRGGWRDEITVRHLLTHTSGLRPDVDLDDPWRGADTAMRLVYQESVRNRPGYVFRYSDINYLLLGEIVHRLSGLPLDEFARRELFTPLRMTDTRFIRCVPQDAPGIPCRHEPPLPPALLARIAPTEELPQGSGMLRGVVHDPTARRMGGVAGHAGLFTTARDLARYSRMLLHGGELDGVRVMKPETVRAMTSLQSPPGVAVRRTGGFDLESGYSRPRGDVYSLGSFGHTGFTGGFFWVDPASQSFYVFMSNRVHPNGRGGVTALQKAIGTLAAQTVGVSSDLCPGQPGCSDLVPRKPRVQWVTGGADVQNGIDVVHAGRYRAFENQRIGLITNHTGIDRAGNPTIDLLRSAPGVELAALFSPEHGIRGAADEKIGDSVDATSGLPIYSLYGERRKPAPEQLKGLHALVFDIQDIGARFYTYVSTMALAMEAAGEAGIRFVVLDRANPIGGVAVEGPILEGDPTFVAFHRVPLRHGMTAGELARLYRAEKNLDVDLQVIALRGWKREMYHDEAGLPWIDTSPNMRTLAAATLYPGLGLLESALSVGRGTSTPFEIAGAPYIDETALVRELTALQLPGVAFEAIRFTPSASTFKNEECGGVRFTITDRRTFRSVHTGIAIATTLRRMYGEKFAVEKMAHLLKDEAVLAAVREAKPLSDIVALWEADEASFREKRAPFLLY